MRNYCGSCRLRLRQIVVKYKSTDSRVNGKRDAETDFDYRIARYYSLSRNSGNSEIGRFLSVDPMATEAMDWTSYRYAFDNPIRLVDPNGMFESLYEYPPEDYQGTSWCDSDGCFNRSSNTGAFKWTDHEGKSKGYYSDFVLEIKEKRSWNNKLVSATEHFFDIKSTDLRGPEGIKAIMKIAGKEAELVITIFSFGEGTVALKGASALGKGIASFGIANDANDLVDDITGFDAIENAFGAKPAAGVSTANSSLGIIESIFNKKPTIGNLGNIKDFIFETPKLFSNDKRQKY